MPIVQANSINTTAQIVPNLLVVVQQPQIELITGVPSGRGGVVGTATWGPVNVAGIVGDYGGYQRMFGPLQPRTYDMGTVVAAAHQQGGNDFRCVRVTDGTDTAASVTALTNCITFTSRYSGSAGNGISVAIAPGSQNGTWRATVYFGALGYVPEVFDNIGAGLSGNALWAAIANAINNGQYGTRSGSEIVIASAGIGTTAPATATYALAGGTDGVAGVSAITLLGTDGASRTGMYVLRGSGCGDAVLADVTDTTTFTTQLAFGKSEGIYMHAVTQAGDTVSNAASAKSTAGIDDPNLKILIGDWVYWNDTVNGLPQRLISPQGFSLGRYMALSPEQSGLNKPIYDIVATQRTKQNRPYSSAELVALGQAGIDVICNPVPGGEYFGLRFGRNSSSNPVVRTDAYTRLTNYIAASLDRGVGRYVGRLNSPETQQNVKITLDSFFQAMHDQGMIEAWDVVCNESNNSQYREALGYLQADVRVTYYGIIETLLVNLTGGASVVITRKADPTLVSQAL